MKAVITRTYFQQGVNGILTINDKFVCHTIELPWRDNLPMVSCIPEGDYVLQKRYSPRFKNHLLIQGVTGRSLILMHPANHALHELQGCIAPVTVLTAPGQGIHSRAAMDRLKNCIIPVLAKQQVYLTIKS